MMDVDSEQGDLILRVYETNYYMCCDLKEGAVDFVHEDDMEPTRFVLSIPLKHISDKKCQITKMNTTSRCLYQNTISSKNMDTE